MVSNKDQRLGHDETGSLSRVGSDAPGPLTDQDGQDGHAADARNGDGDRQTTREVTVTLRPDALHIDSGTLAPNASTVGTDRQSGTSHDVVGWKDLPKKDQLLVITLARLSEPLTQTSLQVSKHIPLGSNPVSLRLACRYRSLTIRVGVYVLPTTMV